MDISSDLFSESNIFAGIEKGQLSILFNFGQRRTYGSGVMLFHEGDPALKSCLVLNGRLKLSKVHEEGKEAIVRYINPGGITGAISVFSGKS